MRRMASMPGRIAEDIEASAGRCVPPNLRGGTAAAVLEVVSGIESNSMPMPWDPAQVMLEMGQRRCSVAGSGRDREACE